MSGGELQRVAIARILNRHTRYLIADEMTAMLDANTQALIWQVILEFAHQHQVGIIAISHDQPLLERICQGFPGAGAGSRIVDLVDYRERNGLTTSATAAPYSSANPKVPGKRAD